MIVLHKAKAQNLNCLGIGGLPDALACTVREEAYDGIESGLYELNMSYPLSGRHGREIRPDCIIMAPPRPNAPAQPFRVREILQVVGTDTVEIHAPHVSCQLEDIPIRTMYAQTTAAAMATLKTHAVVDSPFAFSTDIEDAVLHNHLCPESAKRILCGSPNSIVALTHGELEFDRYQVRLHRHRGHDTGLVISRGQNLVELERSESIQNLVTGYYPYWCSETNPEGIPLCATGPLVTTPKNPWSYPRVKPLDLSSEFDEYPTEKQLAEAAQKHLQDTIVGALVSNAVQFLPIGVMEDVALYDTVRVKVDVLDLDARAKIVGCTYNVLTNQYSELNVGALRPSLGRTIAHLLASERK